jgi:hypothetical protein
MSRVMTFGKNSTQTANVSQASASDARQDAIRARARREIPALRKQAEQGIETLKQLAKRAEQG